MFVQASFAPFSNLFHCLVPPTQFIPNFRCLKRKISVHSSFAPSPNPNQHFVRNENTNIIRRLADFHPSIWGDHFITYAPSEMKYDHTCLEQIEELKENVRGMLVADAKESLKKLSLIDSLQRLGVAYHFEGEIKNVLEQINEAANGSFDSNGDLYTVALQFRLLRQQGYNVPCDGFNRFKSSNGKFKEDLINDVSGMLSLYEATHLRVHGEDILDEVLEFTSTRLKSIVIDDLKPPFATQVTNALEQPFHKGLPRLEARRYISVYQEDEKKNESLLKLAKLNFNLLQSIHAQELSQLSEWWKELDFISKLPWARDRLVECYFWTVGEYFEPYYGFARKFFTKICLLTSIIDDTYDVYGTLEELQLFTNEIERWDPNPNDQLPEYMKVLYSSLLDVYNEIEEDLRKDGQSYRVKCAKEAMKILVRAYFMEAKWFNDGYIPTFEEYMEVASITGGCTHLTVVAFVGMGDFMTKEVFDWVMDEPKLVKASNLIARLMNDITSHKFEQERGHVYSSVECYMEQYGVSEKEVIDVLNKKVEDAWKDINQACMKPTAFPMPLLLRCVNLARITDVSYKYKDGYTLSHEVLKEFITSLFIDPINV